MPTKRLARIFRRKPSLFVQLLASFLAVIILLVSFNFASFIYLRHKINTEIVRYNSLNMQHTMEGYEKHMELLKTTLLGLYQKSDLVVDLNMLRQIPDNGEYNRMKSVQAELVALQANPFLKLDNVIAYFGHGRFVLEKDGSSPAANMFTKFYASPAYPLSFWESRSKEQSDFFHIYPATEFTQTSMNSSKPLGTLLPIVLKNRLFDDQYFIALIDAQSLFQSLHYSPDSLFSIYDADGRMIYSRTALPEQVDLASLPAGSDRIKRDEYYYFYKKGAGTGFTYVTMVPIQTISSQLFRLNLILISLLSVAILIGIGASVLFSIRLNNPVKKIIASIQQYGGGSTPMTRIPEFHMIGEAMRQLADQNDNMNQDLGRKDSLLRYYAYLNKLKRIHTGNAELQESLLDRQPFSLLLLHVHLLPAFFAETGHEPERVTYFIREFVDSFVSRHAPGAVTLQVDADQILVIQFGETPPVSDEALGELAAVLEHDKESAVTTIAVTPVFRQPSDFTAAYEMAVAMIRQRPLGDGTMIVRECAEEAGFRLTGGQEEELRLRLQAGNADAAAHWVRRQLASMREDGRFTADCRMLAQAVAGVCRQALAEAGAKAPEAWAERAVEARTRDCYTEEQLVALLTPLLAETAERLQARAEDVDPISQFVFRYLEDHLGEDISLDTIADKLNMSRGYLSTYFKEKTGVNFSDYLNQLRIQKTKEMLGDSNLKIHDISERLGYQNVNSFIRMFKRYSGMTPGEYRKKILS